MRLLSKTKRAALISQLSEIADAWEAEGQQAFPHDEHMKSVYHKDAEALREIQRFIATEQDTQAAAKAERLDTILREQLPPALWDYLTDL